MIKEQIEAAFEPWRKRFGVIVCLAEPHAIDHWHVTLEPRDKVAQFTFQDLARVANVLKTDRINVAYDLGTVYESDNEF